MAPVNKSDKDRVIRKIRILCVTIRIAKVETWPHCGRVWASGNSFSPCGPLRRASGMSRLDLACDASQKPFGAKGRSWVWVLSY